MPARGQDAGSMLLVEECFSSEDARFLEHLRQVRQPKSLAAFADRWKKDPRPWARQQFLIYLDQPLNCPGHQPLVKRWFKHAEETGDVEVMGRFLVAFDRQVRRKIGMRRRWDQESRSIFEEERLVTPRDGISPLDSAARTNPLTGERMTHPMRAPSGAKLFRHRTRYYLRRRAWRFFRHLGHRQPEKYAVAMAAALGHYRDADLAEGVNILDSWGLLHACFGASDALEFGATHIVLKDGRSFGDLSPAPVFGAAWKTPTGASLLFSLLASAEARLVRVWAMQSFERDHGNHPIQLEELLRLLEHEEGDVQQFAARLLERAPGLATLPVEGWLRLLQTRNHDALQLVCAVFSRHVAPERLTLTQCLELACSAPVPLARLGQGFLRNRALNAPEHPALLALADARCPAVAGELTAWALGILGAAGVYQTDWVMRFLDSLRLEIREATWNWVVGNASALGDAVLWSRLTETPYDDMRLRLIDHLQRQVPAPGEPLKLDHVWQSVLLGVHRGGRQKAKAVRQIAGTIVQEPSRGEALLPVLAAAVRSVRGPEARAGLAAVLSAIEARPELTPIVQRLLPELKLEVPS